MWRGGDNLESALILSCSEKSIAFFTEVLNAASCNQIITLSTCGETRRLLLERDFDIVIINAPLPDESGERLARHVASKGVAQPILVVKSELYDEVSSVCENDGVLTVAKPMNKTIFWSVLKVAIAAQNRMKRFQTENSKLSKKIEDIRIIDRAKCLLISYLGLSEQEAHRHIEKQAMDMRLSRREVAEGILKTYEE